MGRGSIDSTGTGNEDDWNSWRMDLMGLEFGQVGRATSWSYSQGIDDTPLNAARLPPAAFMVQLSYAKDEMIGFCERTVWRCFYLLPGSLRYHATRDILDEKTGQIAPPAFSFSMWLLSVSTFRSDFSFL